MKILKKSLSIICALCMLAGSPFSTSFVLGAENTLPARNQVNNTQLREAAAGTTSEEGAPTQLPGENVPNPIALSGESAAAMSGTQETESASEASETPETQESPSEPAETAADDEPSASNAGSSSETAKPGSAASDAADAAASSETVLEKELAASDGNTYHVTVSYKSDSGIPANAQLQVKEVINTDLLSDEAKAELEEKPEGAKTEEEKREEELNANYSEYMERSARLLKKKTDDLKFALAFDITLQDPATKEEFQPTGDIKVTIRLADVEMEEKAKINVIHFDTEKGEAELKKALEKEKKATTARTKAAARKAVEDATVLAEIGKPELLKSKTTEDAVEFNTDGFSVYVVVTETKEQTLTTSDGSTYKVIAAYDYTAGIPKGAQLAAEEISEWSEGYSDYLAQSAEKLGTAAKNVAYAKPIDIYFLDPETGAHIKPGKNVKISIELWDTDLGTGENVNVVHFGEEVEVVKASVEGSSVSFEAGEFSVYVVIASKADSEEEAKEYEYTIVENGSVRLSSILEDLQIPYGDWILTAANVESVTASGEDTSKLGITEAQGDWELAPTSDFDLIALTLTLNDEINVVINLKSRLLIPVIVSGITANNKSYDGTTAAELDYSNVVFNGLIEGDELTVTAVGSFEDGNVGESKTVTLSDLQLGGAQASKYILAEEGQQTTTTASISALDVTVSVVGANNTSVYDGAEHTVKGYTVTASSNLFNVENISFTPAESAVLIDGEISASGINAGTTDMGLAAEQFSVTTEDPNFNVTFAVTDGYQTITPQPVTLTANGGINKSTGSEIRIDGYTCSVSELTFEGVSASGNGTEPGMYDVTFSGVTVGETKDTTGNYVVGELKNGLLIILASELSQNLIQKEINSINGDLVEYKITVNPEEIVFTTTGDPLTVKDTFTNNQSILYSTISAVDGDENKLISEEFSYDYSGYTGTFTIPDGTAVTITYTTRVQGDAGEKVDFSNTVQLGRTSENGFACAASASVNKEEFTITPTGTDISGTGGVYMLKLFVYPDGHMEAGLEDAVFRLLDSNMQPMTYKAGANEGQPVTFTTGADGYVDITLNEQDHGIAIQKNTVYYLEMIKAPYSLKDGDYIYYQKDNTYYSFLITDNPNYTYGGVYSYYNGDTLKVRCYPEGKGVNVTKRFSGNYTLTDEQKNAIRFILQKEDQGTDSGWVDVESHTYAEFSYGSMNFETGREGGTELEDNATYRVIEENALPEELEGIIDADTTVFVSYQEEGLPVEREDNTFYVDKEDAKAFSYNLSFTNQYVDHKLTIIKQDKNNGAFLKNAEFKVYKDSDPSIEVASHTTDDNGEIIIRWNDEVYETNTLYYAVETAAPDGYVLPENPEKVYFFFSDDNTVFQPDVTATDLTNSYNTVTIENESDAVNVPVTVVWGNNGQAAWPSNVGAVVIGLYKSVDGGEPVQVLDGNNVPRTITLSKTKQYDTASFTNLPALEEGKRVDYSVKEESVISSTETDITDYFASSSSISGTGWYVVKNQEATRVTVKKVWLDQDGVEIGDPSGKPAVTYSLYRTTKEQTFTGDVNRSDLLAFLEDEETDAECVRTGLSITSADNWMVEVPSLEEKDPEDHLYYYYALEDVPDNQEDFYAITAASGEDLRTLTIKNKQTPVTVVIKAADLEKIYGDADPSYEFDLVASRVMEEGASIQFRGPEEGVYTAVVTDSNGSEKEIEFSMDREAGENAGTYTITPSGNIMQQGYRVLFETGTLTINKRDVTVTAGGSKVYGEDEPSLVTIDGLPEGEESGVIEFEVFREDGEDVGTYPITLTGETEQPNYKVTFVRADEEGIPYVFTILPAEATVTADDQTKSYGADDPELTATVTGLKRGDEASVIEYELTREDGENVGEYEITPSGNAEQGNYKVEYQSGTFTINPALVSIKVEDAEKSYGDPDPEWEVELDGLQGNDENGSLSSVLDADTGVRTYTYSVEEGGIVSELFKFTVSREEGENFGEYEITPSGNAEQGNYTLSFDDGAGILSILRAELTVTPRHTMKAVGVEEDPILYADITGWKNGEETSNASYTITEGTGSDTDTFVWTYSFGEGEDAKELLAFSMKREPGEAEGEYPIKFTAGEEVQGNYQVIYEEGLFEIKSVLDVDVIQPVVDYTEANANPLFTYKAQLDLTGTGLNEYSDNGFEYEEGVPTLTFSLPDAENNNPNMKTLKVPGGAKLTVTQLSENNDYVTDVSIDKAPYTNSTEAIDCVIDRVDAYKEIAFTHSRISLPVSARASNGQTEDGAQELPGRTGAMAIPKNGDGIDISRGIDKDFADEMHSKIGYELPNDKYYVYDHASLYTKDGAAVAGASNVSEIQYDRENAKWQYKVGENDFADVPDNAQLVLFYLPKFVCKIGGEKFYSIKAAVDYAVREGLAEAKVEMLIPDYSIRNANEAVTIPEGLAVTITTAEEGFEGEGTAVISRSLSNTAGHLFTNSGTLTISNIILDGKDVAASDALILNQTTAKKESEEDPEPATLTIAADATLRNANGNKGGAIFVKNGVATVNGTLEDNAAQNGGAIYVEKGSLTVNSSSIKGNTASYGGAIYITGGETVINGEIGSEGQPNTAPSGGAVYMTGGSLKVSNGGSLGNNTATNGGAVYLTGGTLELESDSAVANNTATNGGAVYLTGGTLKAGGLISGNTASAGGAIYQYNGTVNSTGTINNNTASDGGAVYIIGGTFNLAGGSISENHSNANGGAVFGGAGTFNVSAGTMQNNTAAQNGGAIYATNATVNIKGGILSDNGAQNGGAVYMSSSTVAISAVEGSAAPTISGNTASEYGGAIYVNLGAVQYSGGSITGNSAVNGAAIFVNSGNGTISAGITGNTASEGGAVGVGNASARLYFKGSAEVSGNTRLNASGDEPERNVYLDKDSDQVINVTEALQAGAVIGVYVPGDVNSDQVVKHGDVGGYFGAYTNTTNVETAFKNDRFAELDAKYENNRLFWGAKLTYDFVYKKAFEPTDSSIAGQSYNATSGSGYLQVALDKAYYPHGAENNEYVIYDLINSMNLYNTYSGTMNTRAGSAGNGAASVYAYTFANGTQDRFDSGLKFSDYLTTIRWNNVARRWDFIKQNGEGDTTLDSNERRVVIIYAAPAYLSITNNNEPGHTLSLSSLLVNGKNVTDAPPYGYATARNGATVTTLQPLSAVDLVLQSGESVKLLFPGAQGKNYTLNGTFDGASADTSIPYTINGDEYTNTGTNVNIAKGLKNNYDAEEIVFGTPLPICKIVDGGVKHEFSLLKDAVQYMIDHKNSGTAYTVEMLVDYLIPKTDAMDIPSGYQVTFTTSQDEDFKGSNKDQTDEAGNALPNRAILSRDVGNSGSSSVQCVVSPEDKTKNSTLTVTNLIFDGRAIAGTGNGGAISSRYCDVTIDNCEFKGYRAVRGGAIFVVRGGTADQAAQKDADGIPVGGLKIYNSHFENCQSSANVDKAGGGAVWTTAKGLVIVNCRFDKDCGCTGGSAQGGAVFHNISDDKTHRFKEFDSDPGNAYYEAGYSRDTKTILNTCVFDNVYALAGAGGAVETDAQDTEITGCRFLNCYTNANGGGGALIAYARDREHPDADWPSSLTISDSEFINSRAEGVSTGDWGGGAVRTTTLETVISNTTFNGATTSKNGAAICVTGKNASSLATFEIYGCTFNDCNAAVSGGAIYCPVKELIIGDYTQEGKEPVHTTFTNCIAGTHGGGAYHASRAGGSFALLQNTVYDSCVARTGRGGGFFGESYDLTVQGNSTLFTNCTAQNDGGGICHNHGWSPNNETTTMKLEGERSGESAGIIFRNCTAVGWSGGAVRASAKNVSLENVLMEGNTATTEGGGIWMSPAVGTSVIQNCEFTDNHAIGSDSKGGSIYLHNGNNILQFINSKVSDSSALNGGGIYQYQVKLYLLGDSIEGEATVNGGGLYVYGNGNNRVYHYSGAISGTAGNNGGGVYYGAGEYHIGNATYEGVAYTGASIGSVSTDSEGNTVYTAVAGNDGGGIYQNDGSLTMNAGASIVGQAAGNGGGVYSRKTLNQDGGDISGSAANGGGVYKTNQNNYTLTTGTVTGTATGNGGAVYLAATTLNFNGGTIGEKAAEGDNAAVHSSATNGGGLYVAGGTVNVKNGTIAGAAATRNGGGLYVAGGTYNFFRGSIVRNVAGENGGGVYHGGGTFKMTTENNATASAVIGGSAENGNTADKGAGLFVADGQKPNFDDWAAKNLQITYNHAVTEGGGIAVGGSSAVLTFKNAVQIQHNTMGADNIECNVYLDQDSNTVIQSSGLDALAYIGVYASDSQDNIHGQSGMPFGKYSSDGNLDHFYNDRRPFLYGMKGSNNLVIWSEFVCKITDGAGNLLFKTASGTPAVYAAVENVNGGALRALWSEDNNKTPDLYYKDAETGEFKQYQGNEFQVQMLVEEYLSTQIKFASNANGRKVKLTTASAEPDEFGFKYQGNPRNPATIKRGNNTWAMIYVGGENGEAWTLTLENITFDGSNTVVGEDGAILRIEKRGKAVLDQNAILKNGNTNNKYNGGGVAVRTSTAQLTMNQGSQIVDCQSSGKAGGGIYMEAGTVTMNGGEITRCTAANGGGVYMTNSTVFNMNGGSITGNNATSTGGGIALNHTNARINFAGLCTVTGNTLSNGERCNVQLNQKSTSIINAKGLDARSEIGIYTPSGEIRNNYGVSGKPFGTWSVDEDKLFCFINDVDTTLRGYQGSNASDKKIYWEFHPLLTVTKTVNSDWAYDREDVDFIFEVKLLDTALTSEDIRSITGINFSRTGEATVTLKAGESATAVFPEKFDKTYYEVREIPTPEQEEDYTVTAEHNDAPYGEFTKPLTVEGQLGENIGTDRSSSLSAVNFINTRVTGDLSISKKVVSEKESDYDQVFNFKLTLNDTTINKTYDTVLKNVEETDATDEDSSDTDTENTDESESEIEDHLTFTGGVAEFTLKHGKSLTIQNLPTDLQYTAEEIVSDEQKANIRIQTAIDGADALFEEKPTGFIGESIKTETDEGKIHYSSKVKFINNFLEIVCKITNRSRELLYYRDTGGNLQPAIYSHLEDAFTQVNAGNLRTSTNGTVSGQLRIEMVVPAYTMEGIATLENGKTVLLSTALLSDSKYPYNHGNDDENGNISVVTRGFGEGSMIDDNGTLTIDRIILDGASSEDDPITAGATGGIINVASPVRLTVNTDATLRNSSVTGNGGAIYLSSGASLAYNGTISNCSALQGGGIYANTGFTTITATGAIANCEATAGKGGAIYAVSGTSVTLNAGTVLTGNKAKTDGGAVYSGANVTLRGTVGGEGEGEGNTAEDNGGGICMGSGTTFTMYAGSKIIGNSADNGGGLAAPGTVRIAGGTLEANSANAETGKGGAVYVMENANLAISGACELKGNTAAAGGAVYSSGTASMSGGSMTGNTARVSGGAVYVADGKTFTMSGGSLTGGNKSPEGAVSTGAGAVLSFSGNSIVTGNTGTDGTTAMNVFLGYDSNSIITTSGLGTNANIGIYVADGDPETDNPLDPDYREDHVDKPIYCDHGLSARNFGTYTGTNINSARLNKFINDRDTTLTGMNGGGNFIAWSGKGLQILISEYLPSDQEESEEDGETGENNNPTPISGAKFKLVNSEEVVVWTGSSNAEGLVSIPWGGEESQNGNKARFAPKSTYTLEETASNKDTVLPASKWILKIGRDNSVTWETVVREGDNLNRAQSVMSPSADGKKAYLGDIFGLNNDIQPKVIFDPMGGKLDGQSAAKEVPVDFEVTDLNHTFTIKEKNPTWDSHVFKKWATKADKPKGEDGTELTEEELAAQGYFEYEKDESILFYRGTTEDSNTQGTSKGDLTLYAQWEAVVCKITDNSGNLLYVNGSPAVYGTLEEGFEAYNTISSFTDVRNKGATARRIEMLVGEYTLNQSLTLNRGKTVMLTTAPKTDKDGYAYTGGEKTVCVITRGESCDTSMITNNSNLTLKDITLDGGSNSIVTDGGIINNSRTSAALSIVSGATLRNSYVDGRGGAVYVNEKTTLTLSGGTINGNSAVDGAGIYVAEGGKLNISGNPYFGGTGVENEKLVTSYNSGNAAGNFAVQEYPEDEEPKNGDKTYPPESSTQEDGEQGDGEQGGSTQNNSKDYFVRQDIFIAGYSGESGDPDANVTSLVVTGAITSGAGSIWVWAEDSPHFKMLEQFALIDSKLRISDAELETTLAAFRNAQDDEETENNTGEYLYGTTGDDALCVYWSGSKGSRKVILRKVDSTYNSLSGAEFTIYKGNSGRAFEPKLADKTKGDSLSGLESKESGVFWTGILPYGVYYLHETTVPNGFTGAGTYDEKTNPNAGRWFYLVIGDDTVTGSRDGVYMSAGFADRNAAKAAYDTWKTN